MSAAAFTGDPPPRPQFAQETAQVSSEPQTFSSVSHTKASRIHPAMMSHKFYPGRPPGKGPKIVRNTLHTVFPISPTKILQEFKRMKQERERETRRAEKVPHNEEGRLTNNEECKERHGRRGGQRRRCAAFGCREGWWISRWRKGPELSLPEPTIFLATSKATGTEDSSDATDEGMSLHNSSDGSLSPSLRDTFP